MFLISIFAAEFLWPIGRTLTLTSHRTMPFSMSQSPPRHKPESPERMSIHSHVRAGDVRLGNDLHQRNAARLKSTPLLPLEVKILPNPPRDAPW